MNDKFTNYLSQVDTEFHNYVLSIYRLDIKVIIITQLVLLSNIKW